MHRVVIVGCGFAGLFAAKALRRAQVEVVVVDRTNHHLFQALLYQVATGVLSEGDIAPPIRDVLRHQRNTRVVLGEVVDVDVDERKLTIDTLGQATTLPYDSLILATGASQSYFGHDEYARHAPGMKTIDDALELRGRIFGAFEIAELEPDDAAREPWLTFAIVGAGPTGVELAGQIAELSRRALRANFRRFDPKTARIVLLDAADTVLGAYPERLRRRAQLDLERLGVEVCFGTRVVGVDETGLDVSTGEGAMGRIEARTKIWAAGVQGSRLGRLLADRAGANVDRAGRVEVHADCSLPGHPELFVVGDLMALNGLPGLAEVARQSGHHAAKTIVRRLRGREPKPFRYVDLGTMSTIARFRAVASIGRLQITGWAGWLMWLFVHLVFLTGFKNRLSAVANWAVAFLGRGRRQRTITKQQVLARTRGLELRDAAWVKPTTEMPVSRKLERQREHPALTELVSPSARHPGGQPRHEPAQPKGKANDNRRSGRDPPRPGSDGRGEDRAAAQAVRRRA
jgi:NADH dehydrogenase